MRLILCFLFLLAPALSAGVYSFSGTGAGAIPDGLDPTPEDDPGNSLVVSFNVTGVTGTIQSIQLVIGITHTYVGDLAVALRAPGGAPFEVVFARAGATSTTDYGYPAELSGVYTFGDASGATNFWAAAAAAGGGVIPTVGGGSGRYQSGTGGGSLGGNGTSRALGPLFASLTTAQINGTWHLLFQDVTQGDTGSVSGASLIIGTQDSGSGGGGGGGGDDGGCSTSGSSGGWLALLVAGTVLFWGLRNVSMPFRPMTKS